MTTNNERIAEKKTVKAIANSTWDVEMVMELDFEGLNEREIKCAMERLVTNNCGQVNVNAYFNKLNRAYAEYVVDNYCFKNGMFDYAWTMKKLRKLHKNSQLDFCSCVTVCRQIWRWNRDNQKATKAVVKKIREYLVDLIDFAVPIAIAAA